MDEAPRLFTEVACHSETIVQHFRDHRIDRWNANCSKNSNCPSVSIYPFFQRVRELSRYAMLVRRKVSGCWVCNPRLARHAPRPFLHIPMQPGHLRKIQKCARSISWVLNRAQIEQGGDCMILRSVFRSAQAHQVQCVDTMAGSSASNILLPVQHRAIDARQ